METTPIGVQASQSAVANGADEALRGLELGDFISLMIAELQNQDPLNPLDNADMLAQLSQIRDIDATSKLTSTLDAVLLGQNIASGANLIGKHVRALSDPDGAGNQSIVTGIVDRVLIENGTIRLRVGASTVDIKNVSEITDPDTSSEDQL